MKRLSLVAAFVVSILSLQAAPLTITHTTAGGLLAELNAAIEADETISALSDITELTIIGDGVATLNATDFKGLRENLPQLEVLDVSQATFEGNRLSKANDWDSGTTFVGGMKSLTKVTIPETITSIGGAAFNGCVKLQSVNLNDNIKVIPTNCFKDCKELVLEALPANLTTVRAEAFRSCAKVTIGGALPESLTEIYNYAFASSGVTFDKLPSGLTKLEQNAFASAKVTFSEIPATLTGLSNEVFSGTRVTLSTFPETLQTVGQGVFSYVRTLPEFTIPNVANLWTTIPLALFFTDSNLTRSFVCRAPAAPTCATTTQTWKYCFGSDANVKNTTFKVLASAYESFQETHPYKLMKLEILKAPVAEPVVEMPEGYDASNIKVAFVVNGVEHTDLTEEVLEGDGEFVITFAEDAELRLYVDEVRYVAAATYADEVTEDDTEEFVDSDQLYKVADAATATKQDVKVPLTVVPDMRQIHVKVGYNATLSGIETTETTTETGITRRGDIFYLTAPGAQVYDMAGRVVASTAANTIDIASLPAGAYLLRAGQTVKKILK